MTKIPCGGFKLDNNFLGMNENDELSLVVGGEGKAYQQLVTDEDGGVKWEDRLAYSDNRVCVSDENIIWCKVSDSLLTGSYDVGSSVRVMYNDGGVDNNKIRVSNDEVVTDSAGTPNLILALRDNAMFMSDEDWSILLPEKGTYFFKDADTGLCVTGAVLGDSQEPEITWDGNIEFTKTIDPKYISSELNEIVLPSSTSGSTKKFKITVDDSGTISATQV